MLWHKKNMLSIQKNYTVVQPSGRLFSEMANQPHVQQEPWHKKQHFVSERREAVCEHS